MFNGFLKKNYLKRIISNYYDVAKPQLLCVWIHMDFLNGGNFSFFQKSKFGGTNTICCIKLFVETFGAMAKVQSKYNVIILKFKTLLELKVDFM